MALTRNDCKECDGTGTVAGSQTHFKCPECAPTAQSDEALIRQMLESMCWAARVMAISEDEAPGYFAAITAACARLEQP